MEAKEFRRHPTVRRGREPAERRGRPRTRDRKRNRDDGAKWTTDKKEIAKMASSLLCHID